MSTILSLPKSACCGCSACSLSCPLSLILMTGDTEGFLYPEIQNPDQCIQCGKCKTVCPIINVETIQIQTHNQQTYAGFIKKTEDLQKSASGGIASAISQKIILEGGVVYGVSYSADFTKAEYKKAESFDVLEEFRSSKYIHAEKGEIYLDVKSSIKSGKPVLFIGLPCEVGGLKCFLRKEYKNLITAELICHSPTSPKVAEEYIQSLERKYQSRIVNFNVRYKKDGEWTPPHLRAEFGNGNVFLEPFYATDYGRAFEIFCRPSCYSCVYKGDKRVADITLGDYWGCSDNDKFWNHSGVSVIFVHTEAGLKLLDGLSNISLIETNLELALNGNPMIFQSKDKSPRRDVFSQVFEKNGLHAACVKTVTLKERITTFAGRYVPKRVKKLIHHIIHSNLQI